MTSYLPDDISRIKKELEWLDGEALYTRTLDLLKEGKLTLGRLACRRISGNM